MVKLVLFKRNYVEMNAHYLQNMIYLGWVYTRTCSKCTNIFGLTYLDKTLVQCVIKSENIKKIAFLLKDKSIVKINLTFMKFSQKKRKSIVAIKRCV